jgi:hypothetical protein
MRALAFAIVSVALVAVLVGCDDTGQEVSELDQLDTEEAGRRGSLKRSSTAPAAALKAVEAAQAARSATARAAGGKKMASAVKKIDSVSAMKKAGDKHASDRTKNAEAARHSNAQQAAADAAGNSFIALLDKLDNSALAEEVDARCSQNQRCTMDSQKCESEFQSCSDRAMATHNQWKKDSGKGVSTKHKWTHKVKTLKPCKDSFDACEAASYEKQFEAAYGNTIKDWKTKGKLDQRAEGGVISSADKVADMTKSMEAAKLINEVQEYRMLFESSKELMDIEKYAFFLDGLKKGMSCSRSKFLQSLRGKSASIEDLAAALAAAIVQAVESVLASKRPPRNFEGSGSQRRRRNYLSREDIAAYGTQRATNQRSGSALRTQIATCVAPPAKDEKTGVAPHECRDNRNDVLRDFRAFLRLFKSERIDNTKPNLSAVQKTVMEKEKIVGLLASIVSNLEAVGSLVDMAWEKEQASAEKKQLALQAVGSAAGIAGALAVGPTMGLSSPIGLAMKVSMNTAASYLSGNAQAYQERRMVVDLMKDMTTGGFSKEGKITESTYCTTEEKAKQVTPCETVDDLFARIETAFSILNTLRQCNVDTRDNFSQISATDLVLNPASTIFQNDGKYGKLQEAATRRTQQDTANNDPTEVHAEFRNQNAERLRARDFPAPVATLTARIKVAQLRYAAVKKLSQEQLGASALNGALATLENIDTVGGGIWGTQGAAVSGADGSLAVSNLPF